MATREEIQQLVQPITAEQPCGENLEDTPLLASFDEFRLFGQSLPLDPVPDWGQVKARSEEALARSKDLRLLAHLASALLRTDGVVAFAATLPVAASWLETYWADTFPLVGDDILFRRNALNCFSDPVAIVDGLRRAPILSSRQYGTFSLRDLEILSGQLQPREGEPAPDGARAKAAFGALPIEELQALHQAVADTAAAIKRIESKMQDDAGVEGAPDLSLLTVNVAKIRKYLATELSARGSGAGAPGEADAPAGTTAAPAGVVAVGAIRTREDAVRALDAVSEYFRRNEPSSPIPLLVDRAKRLVSKDFLEVLAEVAPEALAQARAAGGLRQTD